MRNTEKAAAKVLDGLEQSNGAFRTLRLLNEDTLRSRRRLSKENLEQVNNIDRAICQLVAAVGPDVEHAAIVNSSNNDGIYHLAVFSQELMGYVEFASFGEDPQILVRTVPRKSITEIEVRGATDYRSAEGSLVFVAKYSSGITLDIRERTSDGLTPPRPGRGCKNSWRVCGRI